MNTLLSVLFLIAGVFIGVFETARAQIPGPGNIDWKELWALIPPASPDTTNPHYWMHGARSYTGLAYDKWNDVVYVVNPAQCTTGPTPSPCVRIWALEAETGDIATRIQHAQGKAPPGQLYVDPAIINTSFASGQYAVYKIDLDDQGRIYGANVVVPNFGVCYPGPPPNCDPDYLNQGPFKVYRWNSPAGDPELLYQSSAAAPMDYRMWGTSFDVVGKEHLVNGQPYDSTRIYASGGKFFSGYFVEVNNEIHVFLTDTRPNPPSPFRLGLKLVDSLVGSGFAAHGIAATGPWHHSPLYVNANFRQVVLHEQVQTGAAFPQTYQLGAPLHALPYSVTGYSGPIKYLRDTRQFVNKTYLINADGSPSSSQFGNPNYNTTARVVDLSTGPTWQNWPRSATPQLGNILCNNLTGIDNWITDIDYKIWIDPVDGWPHLQVFVLMSNNGIASYISRYPDWPVELMSFTASVETGTVRLEWATAAETNNQGFHIERSFNGGTDWEGIGFVHGYGTTSVPKEYSFTEPLTPVHSNVGSVHYRLRQVDFDGTFEYSPVVEVLTAESVAGLALGQNYPNPFATKTSISYQLRNQAFVTLRVYNTLGMEVATLERGTRTVGIHEVQFDAGTLPPGVYMYRIDADGHSMQRKMILGK